MALPLDQAIDAFEAHLKSHSNYLLTTHVGPDGDGLGSALGLYSLLAAKGKKASVVIVDPLPEKFHFMLEGYPAGTIRSYPQEVQSKDLEEFDTIVLLDCGNFDRIGPLKEAVPFENLSTVCIDHHIPQGDPAELTLLEVGATATATLIHRLFEHFGVPLDRPAARALYVSFLTETGSFRFSNTDPAVHRVVAELMEFDLEPHRIYASIYESKSRSALGLNGRALSRLTEHLGGTLVHTTLPFSDFEELKAVPEDADGLVNQILSLDTAEMAALLYEKSPGDVKISLRAKNDVDVQKVAAQLGGGGHRKAAGATFHGTLAEAEKAVLDLAVEAVQQGVGKGS